MDVLRRPDGERKSLVGHSEPGLRITVVGAGSWGTTLAGLTAAQAEADDLETIIWAREPDVAADINGRHENRQFLDGVRLSRSLRATTSLPDALDGADALIMAVPSQYFRSVFRQVTPLLPQTVPVLSVVKGIERGTLRRMTEIMGEESDHDPTLLGVLCGPNIAREVAAGQPAATVVALPDMEWGERLQERLSSPSFRVYTNTDVIGCEIAGAVKNVIAIAAGIADGLGFGVNTKAMLVTRGLAELARLGSALGGEPLTFLGLAGNGDLMATCASVNSRNHRVGVELAAGRPIDEIVGAMHMVAEGVDATPGVLALAARAGIEMPIAEQVRDVVDGDRTPSEAVDVLMGRQPTRELEGIAPTR